MSLKQQFFSIKLATKYHFGLKFSKNSSMCHIFFDTFTQSLHLFLYLCIVKHFSTPAGLPKALHHGPSKPSKISK